MCYFVGTSFNNSSLLMVLADRCVIWYLVLVTFLVLLVSCKEEKCFFIRKHDLSSHYHRNVYKYYV